MNPSTKVFATLSLAAAIGKKTETMGKGICDDEIKNRGKRLHDAGYSASEKYPFQGLTIKKIIQIGDAVKGLLGGKQTQYSVISMVIAGLVDIRAKCNPDRWPLIDPVIDCAKDCLDLFQADEQADIDAFERYQEWAS